MLRHYITVTLRNLFKHKLISFINLFGLTVGLTCCLLILAYILHETSYDRTAPQADRIYRVSRNFYNTDGALILRVGSVAAPATPLLLNDFPQIEKATVLLAAGPTVVRYQDNILNEDSLYFADENFLGLFGVRTLSGDARTALREPNAIVLEQRTARKYFGAADPMGKQIRFDGRLLCKVTGVYQGLPPNAHLHPAALLSFSTLRDSVVYGARQLRTNWGNNSFFAYLQLKPGYPAAQLEAQFPAFLDRHLPPNSDGSKPSRSTALQLQRLTDIHLHSQKDYELEPNGDISRVYIFGLIALFVLLIACINYMNLSTARAALRAKEIGVRKVVGAQRSEIIIQFLGESVLITALAMGLALACSLVALPWLGHLAGSPLSPALLWRGPVLLGLGLLPVVVGVLSGLYPALFMSSFQPQQILKGFLRVSGGLAFRRVLVVVQFVVSIGLLVSTAVVVLQLRYLQQAPLGYSREQVLTMPYPSELGPQYAAFRLALQEQPGVREVGRSSRVPTGRLLDAMDASVGAGSALQPTKASIKYVNIDDRFVPAYGVALAAGRNFSPDFPTDTTGFILNATAVRVIGWKSPAEAIGQDFKYGPVTGKIVGVVQDFHFESLHQAIVPLVFFIGPQARRTSFNVLTVKLAGANVPATLAHLERTWKKFLPEQPYRYTFLDETYANLYQAERRQSTLFTIFAGIAIFIACLGLFGLSAFAITQRVKEIGIRKVLGASVANIVGLLSRDFLRLVGLAALLAFPLSWYAMHAWLQGFAYRIAFPWWVLPLAGLMTVFIALVTIASQTIHVATANPVKSLRTE